jgi:hypothetical protein
MSSKWSLPFSFPDQNFVCIFSFPHACQMLLSTDSHSFLLLKWLYSPMRTFASLMDFSQSSPIDLTVPRPHLRFPNCWLFLGWGRSPRPTPNLEEQVSIFISPGDWVVQLYPQVPSTHFSRLLRHAWATVGLFFSLVTTRGPHSFHHPNNTSGTVQIMKLLITKFLPSSCIFLSLKSEYSSQHRFFKPPSFDSRRFLLDCDAV